MRLTSTLASLATIILATVLLTGCGGGPSGTYEAKEPGGEGTMTLDFQKGNKVKVAMGGGGMKMEFDCEYTVDGDKVTIKSPQGMPAGDTLVLTKKGSTYEANMMGDQLVFTKK